MPASFLLAHFGGEMASDESRRIAVTVLALGGLTLLPILVRLSRPGGEAAREKAEDSPL